MNTKCLACGLYKTRGVTIDALIIRNTRILLIKRKLDPYKNLWALPGGHLDFDETIEDAVRREVKEETGLVTTTLKLLGVFSQPQRHPGQFIAVAFVVETTGEPIAGDDAGECNFFPLTALPKPLAFDHTEMIKKYLEKRNFFIFHR